jgi:penicillin amidase
MRIERETIAVEGQGGVAATLRFTRHGPVLFQDSARNIAYALRAAWLDYGAAPYLASLRMNQATTWEEFREACTYSHIPGENMVWADRAGNIGWQAVGVAPLRPNWSGLVPVPGDGRFEWEGYLPIEELPHTHNPTQGFYATANESQVGADYPHRRAIGWTWADPFRGDRVDEVLGSGRKLSLADMMQLQHDELSIPARTLVPLLEHVEPGDPVARTARAMLLAWDHVLDRESIEAGVYVAWERRLAANVRDVLLPEAARSFVASVPLTRIVQSLLVPDGRYGADPIAARDSIVAASLEQAIAQLGEKLGNDMKGWRYGQERYKHALIRHPMSGALPDSLRARLDVGPHDRGGYGVTVNATGGGDNQTSGASFRIIADLSDWDLTVGTNTPGQSGDPASPHYRDLFPLWAQGRYFPVFYSRPRVEEVTSQRTVLTPR